VSTIDEASPMVKRWKLAIQEFDFDIEHFPGHLNKVADPLSRINMPEEVSEKELNFLCPLMDETRIPNDKYKIIISIHLIYTSSSNKLSKQLEGIFFFK
jgi:hypothetical protein